MAPCADRPARTGAPTGAAGELSSPEPPWGERCFGSSRKAAAHVPLPAATRGVPATELPAVPPRRGSLHPGEVSSVRHMRFVPLSPRRRVPGRLLVMVPPVAALLMAACSADRGATAPSSTAAGSPSVPTTATVPSTSTEPMATPAPTTAAPKVASTVGATDETSTGDVQIRLAIGEQMVTAQLWDIPAAHDLVDQLPLTLTFRDLNNVEKIAPLPAPLTMDGVPAGDDPEVNDIGYYAPSGDLVLYYGDVGYWTGIVRLGRIDADMAVIRDQPDGFQITVDR